MCDLAFSFPYYKFGSNVRKLNYRNYFFPNQLLIIALLFEKVFIALVILLEGDINRTGINMICSNLGS